MDVSNRDYMRGWTDLAVEVQQTLHSSIDEHHGATTPKDMLAVLNDMITFSHRLRLIQSEYHQYLESEDANKTEIEGRILYLAVDNEEG